MNLVLGGGQSLLAAKYFKNFPYLKQTRTNYYSQIPTLLFKNTNIISLYTILEISIQRKCQQRKPYFERNISCDESFQTKTASI